MTRARVSIAGLMAVVLVGALGLKALRSPTPLWAGGMYTLTLIALALAVPGGIYRRGSRRAFWLGFVTFGWGYWLVSLSPWIGAAIRPNLITSSILADIRIRFDNPVVGGPAEEDLFRREFEKLPQVVELSDAIQKTQSQMQLAEKQVRVVGDAAFLLHKKLAGQLADYQTQSTQMWDTMMPVLQRRLDASLTTGPDAMERFHRVGHGLFSLLSGLLGGMIFVRFHQTSEAHS